MPAEIIDSHNLNCYAYMNEMLKLIATNEGNLFVNQEVNSFFSNSAPSYDSKTSYANIYTYFLKEVEDKLESDPGYYKEAFKKTDKTEGLTKYSSWINSLYHSKTNILNATYERFSDELAKRALMGSRPESVVKNALSDQHSASHTHTPRGEGSNLGRFSAMISSNFKPMHTTSIPSIRDYKFTESDTALQELRFGTVAQRNNGIARVSPLFHEWLTVHEKGFFKKSTSENTTDNTSEKSESIDDITHVYFNLLGLDRNGYEGNKERELTLALHDLEAKHPNIIVITLPADKGLMEMHAFEKNEISDGLTQKSAFIEMFKIATGQRVREVQDFKISPKAKELLYGSFGENKHNIDNERKVIGEALERSFSAMGIKEGETITPAQQQGVWFHFNKFEFPKIVLDKLKPNTWNTSCKDAIDRGGVASAYQNLLTSFSTTTPMNRDEFEQALHASAALVKGRGLNHHYEIIWNAVNQYVDANFDSLADNSDKSWLIHWRNDNTPHSIAKNHNYIDKVITQNTALLEKKETVLLFNELPFAEEPSDNKQYQLEAINMSKGILLQTREQLFDKENKPKSTSGKRLLLEVISQVTQLSLEPEKAPKANIENTFNQLKSHSTFSQIRGAFKSFIGLITSFTSWGKKMREKGKNTSARYSSENIKNATEIEGKFTVLKTQVSDIKDQFAPTSSLDTTSKNSTGIKKGG